MFFTNHFHCGAFWECCQLAALGPLFVEQRLISVDMKSSYLFLLCYDTMLLALDGEAYCDHRLYETSTCTQTYK